MHHIDLAYAGHGIHEELIGYVADQEGYYEDENVHVAIRDGVHWPIERLRRGATIGLGRSLLSRLTDDIGWTVLSVNTHRPLFWFLGGAEVTSMADLRGRRLAVHAGHTAPGCFVQIVLRKHGLDPDRDLTSVPRDPGDYQMDLRHLRDGSIDWVRQADVDEGMKQGLSSEERAELVRLRRENRIQAMEIDILKRASALFARDHVLPK
jgi:hypothetical protein